MRTTWRRPILAAATCIALAVPIVAAATPAMAADASSIRINEVESDGGLPGDWIELRARPAAPARFRGWGGACAGQPGTTCLLRVTGEKATVTAEFT